MTLLTALNNCANWTEIRDILNHNVTVNIDKWEDSVAIEGYSGTVTTDQIASLILIIGAVGFLQIKEGSIYVKRMGFNGDENPPIADVSKLLKEKIFIPLRDQLIDLEKTSCFSTLHYKINNVRTRMILVKPALDLLPLLEEEGRDLTGGYRVLYHSLCVTVLDLKFKKSS